MARRSGQAGSLERKGSAWYVRFWIDVEGQERRVHRAVRICPVAGRGAIKSKPALLRRAKEIIQESGADTEEHFNRVQGINLGTTFQQQADWWLRRMENRRANPVKPHTIATWKGYVRYLNSQIGHIPLASIKNPTLGQLVDTMVAKPYAAKTIRGHVQVVKMVIASAKNEEGELLYPRKWDRDQINAPAALPQKERTRAFTGDEVTKILVALSPYWALYAVLAGTGMRIGEALGLEVTDVSADGQILTIKQSVWNGAVQSPKTAAALREIDLHPQLAAMLVEHLAGRKTGYVFQSSRGTPLQLAHVLVRDLHPILASIGMPKTGFHAFRRFRATFLRKQRVSEDLLRFWIGHSAKSITDGYSKVGEDLVFRRQIAATVPLGFTLPGGNLVETAPKPAEVVPIVPKGSFVMSTATA